MMYVYWAPKDYLMKCVKEMKVFHTTRQRSQENPTFIS